MNYKYIDNNGLSYMINTKQGIAIILNDTKPKVIEIFPKIEFKNKSYEVVFPDDCEILFSNSSLEEFKLHKLLHETTNVTSISGMFYGCVNLKTLDLSNFNTDNVNSMEELFYGCENLTEINAPNLYITEGAVIPELFKNCKSLTKINIPSIGVNCPIDALIA